MANLLASVQIAIVMVAGDLKIRRFTPMAERVLNLIPTDIGRPISDIKPNIDVPELEKLIAEAIDSVTIKEQEVRDRYGNWYTLRVRPYKSVDNRIDGAVLALFDIGEQKRRSADLVAAQSVAETAKDARDVAEAVVETVREPLLVLGRGLEVLTMNKAFRDLFGVTDRETLGRSVYDLGDGQWKVPALARLLEEVLPKMASFADVEVEHDFPGIGRRRMRLNGRRVDLGEGRDGMILLGIEDITVGAEVAPAAAPGGREEGGDAGNGPAREPAGSVAERGEGPH